MGALLCSVPGSAWGLGLHSHGGSEPMGSCCFSHQSSGNPPVAKPRLPMVANNRELLPKKPQRGTKRVGNAKDPSPNPILLHPAEPSERLGLESCNKGTAGKQHQSSHIQLKCLPHGEGLLLLGLLCPPLRCLPCQLLAGAGLDGLNRKQVGTRLKSRCFVVIPLLQEPEEIWHRDNRCRGGAGTHAPRAGRRGGVSGDGAD